MTSLEIIEQFAAFSVRLRDSLAQREDVLGLVLLGSTADHSRVDEWSDHDFFVITKAGAAEAMRQDLSWLPDHESIAIAPRETDHGLKVVYQNAHVLEFAVFNDEELELAGANTYEVAWDRSNITSRMEAIATKSKPKAFDFDVEWELFLSLLLIGVGRARRGELLVGGQFVRSYCLDHLLGFIRFWQAPLAGTEGIEDSFNRFRRFEKQYPELAPVIDRLLQLPVEESAEHLLALALKLGSGNLTVDQIAQAQLVRARFGFLTEEES